MANSIRPICGSRKAIVAASGHQLLVTRVAPPPMARLSTLAEHMPIRRSRAEPSRMAEEPAELKVRAVMKLGQAAERKLEVSAAAISVRPITVTSSFQPMLIGSGGGAGAY